MASGKFLNHQNKVNGMDYIYIDESGELAKQSDYFVFGAIITNNPELMFAYDEAFEIFPNDEELTKDKKVRISRMNANSKM